MPPGSHEYWRYTVDPSGPGHPITAHAIPLRTRTDALHCSDASTLDDEGAYALSRAYAPKSVRETGVVLIVRGTKKVLDRIGGVTASDSDRSTTRLGDRFVDEHDLLSLSLRLAETPCGPLYKRHISPDRELAAIVRSHR